MTTQPGFEDADGFYESLLNAHLGLSREQSEALNARLILSMANTIGSAALLATCLDIASQE